MSELHSNQSLTNSALASSRIVFIGAGSMAEAIIRGIVTTDLVDPVNLCAINRSNQVRLTELRERYGIRIASDQGSKNEFIKNADIVFVACKPADAVSSLKELRPLLHEKQLLISVVAGVSIETIQSLLQTQIRIVRTMPNTSSTIGLGATGISYSSHVEQHSRTLVSDIFRSIGHVCEVEERLLDIVTGVSGSGPAYVYYFMESMIRGGVLGGLTVQDASQLTLQTVLGAVQMVIQTEENPTVLRKRVTSPNGTTQAALELLDQFQVRDAVTKAVLRAAERAEEIGKEITASTRLFEGKDGTNP